MRQEAPIGMGSLHLPQGLGYRYAAPKRRHPPLAAPDPTGNPHFDPPRRKARGANLRIRSSPHPRYAQERWRTERREA